LADNSLVQIHLEDAAMESLSIFAVMPSRPYFPNRVNAFLRALQSDEFWPKPGRIRPQHFCLINERKRTSATPSNP
jgi:hypothetical protein